MGVTLKHRSKVEGQEGKGRPVLTFNPSQALLPAEQSANSLQGLEALGDQGLSSATSAFTLYTVATMKHLLSQPVWGVRVRQGPRTGAIRATTGHLGDRHGATWPAEGGTAQSGGQWSSRNFLSSQGTAPLCQARCQEPS